MLLYEQNNVELEYHAEVNILEVRWMGILEPEPLRQMIHKIIELTQTYTVENILLDATQVNPGSRPARFTSQILPYFEQHLAMPTLKKIARIASGQLHYEEQMAQLYATLVQENKASFAFKTFSHHYEAIHWLTDS